MTKVIVSKVVAVGSAGAFAGITVEDIPGILSGLATFGYVLWKWYQEAKTNDRNNSESR